MGLMGWIKGLFGAAQESDGPAFDAEAFVFLVIKDAVGPLQREDTYEEPLDAALQASGLGRVTGGGTQLGEKNPDGTNKVAWCGVDVDLTSRSVLDAALDLLRSELSRLGAPAGTEVHYTSQGERLLDRLEPGGWITRRTREELHPGFGC